MSFISRHSIKFAAVIVAALTLSGCSHNILTYGDGIAFETTVRPDSGNFGIILRYGKILSVCARENTAVEMTGEGGNGGSGTDSASATASVKMTVGPQITGYYVDAIEAGADPESLANNH